VASIAWSNYAEMNLMADVEIDWTSVTIHRGTFTVRLHGAGAHQAEWVALFNESVPPAFTTSWGQITGRAPTLDAWDQIVASDNGTITVHALHPSHARQLKDTLESYVAEANTRMTTRAHAPRRAEARDPERQAELDERDQAMLEEFRQLQT
jgi:hypothetical protein